MVAESNISNDSVVWGGISLSLREIGTTWTTPVSIGKKQERNRKIWGKSKEKKRERTWEKGKNRNSMFLQGMNYTKSHSYLSLHPH